MQTRFTDTVKSTAPATLVSAVLFGVYADQTVCVDSPYFWNEAFALQHTASGQVACPAFLQPLAQGVLSTGKSLLLLRAHQDQHRRSDRQPICRVIAVTAICKA